MDVIFLQNFYESFSNEDMVNFKHISNALDQNEENSDFCSILRLL